MVHTGKLNSGNENVKNCVIAALSLAVIILIAIVSDYRNSNTAVTTKDSIVVDTISYKINSPKDSFVVRYKTKTFYKHFKDTLFTEIKENASDSSKIEIPISQKVYEAKEYKAYISGYDQNLDSIYVYKSTETKTLTITKEKKCRFGVGISAGYGAGVFGLSPYFGLSVNYSIFSW